ncbi:MAG: heterocyst specific transport system permease protein [Gammaproteobacteria bacterium]|nr:heterocyst specific transport system permease protein [Gammaproteobacteria bacterium]
MTAGLPVAFLQLRKHPRRLLIATAGIAMSALGILCQMGFEDSLFRSATRLFQELDADLVVISPQYQFMVLPAQFSERRLYQARSVPGVRSFSSVRLAVAPFKNPVSKIVRNVYVVGISRGGGVFANPEWERQGRNLRDPDEVLFDSRSRPEFGPIGQLFATGPLYTEIANQRVRITGLFEMGASFSADGTVITTDEGFARLFPSRSARMVDVGLIHLRPGAVAAEVSANLRARFGRDVVVLTHDELNEREQTYWRGTTPAGFIFKTVLIVSLIVGCVSVYQILSSDVAENLRQYATLKAIGYPDSYFVRLTLEKAWLLTSLAYPVGFLLTTLIYFCATHLTLVPLVMTTTRAIGVYGLILAAAAGAGMLAMSRLRRVDFSELL